MHDAITLRGQAGRLKKSCFLLLASCLVLPCLGEQYLTTDEAIALVFENPKQVRKQEMANREPSASDKLLVFTGELRNEKGRGIAFIDNVIGKHEPITYLVALNAKGEVQRVEILEYREAYGGQIRQEEWREQFHGKKPGDPLKHGEQIENIAGATLSCKHVTEGVAKILKIFKEKKEEILGE